MPASCGQRAAVASLFHWLSPLFELLTLHCCLFRWAYFLDCPPVFPFLRHGTFTLSFRTGRGLAPVFPRGLSPLPKGFVLYAAKKGKQASCQFTRSPLGNGQSIPARPDSGGEKPCPRKAAVWLRHSWAALLGCPLRRRRGLCIPALEFAYFFALREGAEPLLINL